MTLSPRAAVIPIAALAALPFVCDAAASCREEIDRFERELNDSGLAASAPDRYAELARAAEEAAELRDESVCMERIAELDAELDAAASAAETDEAAGAAPPAAPVLR